MRYINCYNAGTVSAPNAEDNQTYVLGASGFRGANAFRGLGVLDDPYWVENNLFYRTTVINIFNYGKATIGSGESERPGSALYSDFHQSEHVYEEFYNVFIDESGASIHSGVSGAPGLGEKEDDPESWMWGTEFVQSKAPRKNRTEFADGTILAALNDYYHESDYNHIMGGTYPGREGGVKDGSPKWVQDGDFPELLIFRQDLLDAAEDGLGKAKYQAAQAAAPDEASAQAGASYRESVEIDIERKDGEKLEDDKHLTDAQIAALNNDSEKVREVYDVSVTIDGDKKNFETDGKLTVGLPYRLNEDEGEVPAGVWSVYVAENGSKQRMTEDRKYENGKAYFKTSHLSVYAVTYEQPYAFGGGGGCDAGAGMAGAMILALGIALTARNGKRRS